MQAAIGGNRSAYREPDCDIISLVTYGRGILPGSTVVVSRQPMVRFEYVELLRKQGFDELEAEWITTTLPEIPQQLRLRK